jgi:hypothetical protein
MGASPTPLESVICQIRIVGVGSVPAVDVLVIADAISEPAGATQIEKLHAGGSRVETISRTLTPSTCSAPMRWIFLCVRRLLELVATKGEPLLSGSPNSGVDAHATNELSDSL